MREIDQPQAQFAPLVTLMHNSILTSWNTAKTAKNPTSLPQSKTTTHHSTTARCSMVGWCFKLRIPTLSLSLRYVPLILHGFQPTKTLHHRNWRSGQRNTWSRSRVISPSFSFLSSRASSFPCCGSWSACSAEKGFLGIYGDPIPTYINMWLLNKIPGPPYWNESSSNHLSTPHVVPWKQPVIPRTITMFGSLNKEGKTWSKLICK